MKVELNSDLVLFTKAAVGAHGMNNLHAELLIKLLNQRQIKKDQYFERIEKLLSDDEQIKCLFEIVSRAHQNARDNGTVVPSVSKDSLIDDIKKTLKWARGELPVQLG